MTRALRIRLGFDEAPLTPDRLVFMRAVRVAFSAQLGGAAGVFALARPVAVIDRRVDPPTMRPVLDPTLAMTGASVGLGLLALTRALLRRRRRARSRKTERK
jgi:hypothetical protein